MVMMAGGGEDKRDARVCLSVDYFYMYLFCVSL